MDIDTVFLLLSLSRYSQIIRFVNVQILSFCSTFSGLGFGQSTFTFSQANFLCPLALLFFFFFFLKIISIYNKHRPYCLPLFASALLLRMPCIINYLTVLCRPAYWTVTLAVPELLVYYFPPDLCCYMAPSSSFLSMNPVTILPTISSGMQGKAATAVSSDSTHSGWVFCPWWRQGRRSWWGKSKRLIQKTAFSFS